MKKTLLCVSFSVVLMCGCVSATKAQAPEAGNAQNNPALAKSLVGGLFEKYRSFTLQAFSDAIAPDFIPLRNEFIAAASQSAHASDVLDIDFSIEKILPANELLSVSIKWRKRSRALGSSEVILNQGEADLVFKQSQNNWKLYQVNGESPF